MRTGPRGGCWPPSEEGGSPLDASSRPVLPVRPVLQVRGLRRTFDAELAPVRATRGVPATVAMTMALLGAAALFTASWASVRVRRREFAVLRALGFQRRQVRRSVQAQSLTTTAGALMLGTPIGVLAGRVYWRSFAEALGVLADPPSPLGPVLLAVVVALALGLAAGIVPGRLATRSHPAVGLRTE